MKMFQAPCQSQLCRNSPQNVSNIKVHYVYDKNEENSIPFYLNVANIKSFQRLKNKIENYLFNEGNFPKTTLHFYWFDSDGEEINILVDNDFQSYIVEKAESRKDLWVRPKYLANKSLGANTTNTKEKTKKRNRRKRKTTNNNNNNIDKKNVDTPNKNNNENNATTKKNNSNMGIKGDDKNNNKNNNNKAINGSPIRNVTHVGTKCNHCLMHPIVGFRYKCIECHNYDICENCERKHVHLDHMMMRMPNNNCSKMLSTNSRLCNACDNGSNTKITLKEVAAFTLETKSNSSTRVQKRIHRLLSHVYGMFENCIDTFVRGASTNAQIQGNDAQTKTVTAKSLLSNNNHKIEGGANITQKISNAKNVQHFISGHAPTSTTKLNKATENGSSHLNNKNVAGGEYSAATIVPNLPLEALNGARSKIHAANLAELRATLKALMNSNRSDLHEVEASQSGTSTTVNKQKQTTIGLHEMDMDMDMRVAIVYHPDPLINTAIHQMMLMGFSNENGALTQLVESVNGNISEALDLISADKI